MPETQLTNQSPSSLQPRPYKRDLIRKMFTLFAMLTMVLYAMNEAGKPENWAWMGFRKPPASSSNDSLSNNKAPTVKATAELPAGNNAITAPPSLVPPSLVKSPARTPPLNTPLIRLAQNQATVTTATTSGQQTGLPVESGRFWSSFFESLKTAEQVEWMDLLEGLGGNQLSTRLPANQAQSKLIARAEKQRDAFNNKVLDRISSLPQASGKRTQVSQGYFEANKFWQKQISPALTASKTAEDITLLQQQAVNRLLSHLDIDALNLVQDKTAIGWTGDSVAWKRCWNRIHQSQVGSPTYVKRIQLIGQPREFRGEAITVNGFVRSIETRRAPAGSSIIGEQSVDGQSSDEQSSDDGRTYYILWVQPSDSDASPYCVYCLDPPAQLPRTQEELKEYQWLAKISGIFFKNRTYQATDRVRYSPLILADSFEMKPPVTDHPALKWKPSIGLMAGLLALIPLVAVGIVWYAVRSTVSRKRLPSKKSQEELSVFLGDLENDPSIKNDLEQIQAIAEHEDDIT